MRNISCCDCWASGPKKELSQEYLKGTDFFLDLEGDKQLKAIEAAWNHRNTCQPAPPVPEPVEDPHPQDMLWGVPGQAAAPADRPTDADRLALALCVSINGAAGCPIGPCEECSRRSTAVARELAQILRERHGGSSQVADWLDGVGNG